MANSEDAPALLGVDSGQVLGGVLQVGLFVPQNQTGLNLLLERGADKIS